MLVKFQYGQKEVEKSLVGAIIPNNQGNTDSCIVVTTGLGVIPPNERNMIDVVTALNEESYTGKEDQRERIRELRYGGFFPFELAARTNLPVYVVYQPGVSGLGHGKNLFDKEGLKLQDKAIHTIRGKRKVYVVSHSYGTVEAGGRTDFIHGETIIAPFISVEESLKDDDGKPRTLERLLGNSMTIHNAFKVAGALAKYGVRGLMPVNPIQDLAYNVTPEDGESEAWKLGRWIHTSAVPYILELDGIELASGLRHAAANRRVQVALGKKDKVSREKLVRGYVREAGVPDNLVVELGNSAHNPFVSKKDMPSLVDAIVRHSGHCFASESGSLAQSLDLGDPQFG
jgi:hypothetical protein